MRVRFGEPRAADHTAHALQLYRHRRQRDEILGAELFGEPAWDFLLELYVARGIDRPVSMASACTAASVTLAAGLRWVSLLEQHGLVKRLPRAGGEALTRLALTDEGFESMTALLGELE